MSDHIHWCCNSCAQDYHRRSGSSLWWEYAYATRHSVPISCSHILAELTCPVCIEYVVPLLMQEMAKSVLDESNE